MTEEKIKRKGRDRTTLTLTRHSPMLEQGELVIVTEKGYKRFVVECREGTIKFKEAK